MENQEGAYGFRRHTVIMRGGVQKEVLYAVRTSGGTSTGYIVRESPRGALIGEDVLAVALVAYLGVTPFAAATLVAELADELSPMTPAAKDGRIQTLLRGIEGQQPA